MPARSLGLDRVALSAIRRAQFFEVDSRGRIGFPSSRLPAGKVFDELADRLNAVVPRLQIVPGDIETKSKGGQLSDLFVDDQQVRAFFEVWSWFKSAE